MLVQVLRNYIQATNSPQNNKHPLPQTPPVGSIHPILQNDIFIRQTLLFGRQKPAPSQKTISVFETKKLPRIDAFVPKAPHTLLFQGKNRHPALSKTQATIFLTAAGAGWPAKPHSKGAYPVAICEQGLARPKQPRRRQATITYPEELPALLPPIQEYPPAPVTETTPLLLTWPEAPSIPTATRSVISHTSRQSFHDIDMNAPPAIPMSSLSAHTPMQSPSLGPYQHETYNTPSVIVVTEEREEETPPRRHSKRYRRNSSQGSGNIRPRRRIRTEFPVDYYDTESLNSSALWANDLDSVAPGSAISGDDYGSRFDLRVIRNQHRFP